MTRVRNGSNLFLKSYDISYIKAKKGLQEKVAAFRKFNAYQTKKIYLDERIFTDENREFKFGYLNCNGLMNASHAEYINSDRNLLCLHILTVAETKLCHEYKDGEIEEVMDNWRILGRYDAPDGRQHMGLIILTPRDKYDRVNPQMQSYTKCPIWKKRQLQIQGMRVNFVRGLELGFVYCKETPTFDEIEEMKNCFQSCHFFMGDLNLSTKKVEDKGKLDLLCSEDNFLALNEITRLSSSNQIDHIIAKNMFKDGCFCTSYINISSDHKSIVARMGDEFLPEFLQRITFDAEKHLKKDQDDPHQESLESGEPKELDKKPSKISLAKKSRKKSVSLPSTMEDHIKNDGEEFCQRFRNQDMSTCWLNSCLQLLLNGLDHMPYLPRLFSTLGCTLLNLKLQVNELDPLNVKNIVVSEENRRRERNPTALYLDLENGQQCVRDFWIALTENRDSWPDIYELIHFKMVEQTICTNPRCLNTSTSNIYSQLYLEMEIPPPGSNFSYLIEQELNNSFTVDYHCERPNGGCGKRLKANHRTTIDTLVDKHFLIVVLSRVTFGPDGQPQLNSDRVNVTDEVNIMDKSGVPGRFQPIAVIEHSGFMRADGQTRGHYLCDVKTKEGTWFRTSDDKKPSRISTREVTKKATVILYFKQ